MDEKSFYAAITDMLLKDRDYLPPAGPDTDLWHDGYLDSLGLLSLLVRLEEEHDVFVPATGEVKFDTMRSIWAGVRIQPSTELRS